MGSLQNMETITLFMPDFKKVAVQDVMRMLRFEWKEEELWDSEVVELLGVFQVNVGNFEVKTGSESTGAVGESITGSDQEGEVETGDQLDHPAHNEEAVAEYEVPRKNIENNRAKPREVKCPNCPRTFSGTNARLKDMLKCHIGFTHFKQELNIELNSYFGSSQRCKECKKMCSSSTAKRKHLVFHHTEFGKKVLAIVMETVDSKSEVDVEETAGTSSSDNFEVADSVHSDEKDELGVINPSDKINDNDEANVAEISIAEREKGDLLMRTPLNSTISKVMHDGDELCTETSDTFYDVLKDFDSKYPIIMRCTFNCDATWKKSEKHVQIKDHILSHFKAQFSELYEEYFQGSKCIKCGNKTPFRGDSNKDKHLHGKHGFFRTEIADCLESIIRQSEQKQFVGNSDEALMVRDEVNKILGEDIEENTNEHDIKVNSPKTHEDRVEDIDALLNSDDEQIYVQSI